MTSGILNNIETFLIALLPLSIFVERTTEAIKSFIYLYLKKNNIKIPNQAKVGIAAGISIAVCFIFEIQIDLGFELHPILLTLITGVILSGGSTLVHALLGLITSIKDNNEQGTTAITAISEQGNAITEIRSDVALIKNIEPALTQAVGIIQEAHSGAALIKDTTMKEINKSVAELRTFLPGMSESFSRGYTNKEEGFVNGLNIGGLTEEDKERVREILDKK